LGLTGGKGNTVGARFAEGGLLADFAEKVAEAAEKIELFTARQS